MRLSESRAKAFVAYMKDKEKMDPSLMKVNWMGEGLDRIASRGYEIRFGELRRRFWRSWIFKI